MGEISDRLSEEKHASDVAKAKSLEQRGELSKAAYAYSDAAITSLKLSQLSPEQSDRWLQTTIEERLKSGELCKNRDSKHAMHCFSIAAECERKLAQSTGKKEFLRKSCDYYLVAAAIAEGKYETHYYGCISHAADVLEELFDIDGTLTLGEEVYKLRVIFRETNPASCAFYQGRAARIAGKIAKKPISKEEKIKWYNIAKQHLETALRLANPSPQVTGAWHAFTGEYAFHLYKCGETTLEDAYEHYRKAADLLRQTKPGQAKKCIHYATICAQLLQKKATNRVDLTKWTVLHRESQTLFEKWWEPRT